MTYTYLCSNIDYDLDDDVQDELPCQVSVVLDELYDEDTLQEVLGDAITNSTGWCVNSFEYKLGK